ncbi:MAG TPA: membrane-bound lytic murein transglycosylase MltF [Burkholderiales bacterium]|nr:membrane-bound lytic murein transglycosylase MltF [Burkholderiales bacterium]
MIFYQSMVAFANKRLALPLLRAQETGIQVQRRAISAYKVIVAALLIILPSCDPGTLIQRPVLPFGMTDELVVLVRNSPSTRFLGADGKYVGIEQDLLEMFAKDIGMRMRLIEYSNFADILPALRRNTAHFAAAGLSATEERRRDFLFGPAYQSVQKVVAYNTDRARPHSIKDLVGKRVAAMAGTSSAEQLRTERESVAQLRWDEVPTGDAMALLDQLADGDFDYVVTDSNVVDLAQNFLPNIARAFPLGTPETLAWALPKDANPLLANQISDFFARINGSGALRVLLDRYYGHIERLDQGDVVAFLQRRATVLPQYRSDFQEAQDLTGVDWRLLAALGFQESHWNPLATSPTGVRGLMMLTSETADRMNVSDRLDARQNIIAGARYFRMLKDTLPDRIPEPDRTWMALASYNVGYGHLEDARILTQRRGMNPDSWIDVRKTLPLLARSDYYTTVRRGFARGGEAVILTENIRNYYDILVRYEDPHRPLFSDAGTLDARVVAP